MNLFSTLNKILNIVIINTVLYIRIFTRIVWKNNAMLFLRVLNNGNRKKDYLRVEMFFLTNVFIAVILPLTNNIPDSVDVGVSYVQTFSDVNKTSVRTLMDFFSYIFGAITFAWMLSKVSYRIIKKNISFKIMFGMICYASAWFIPIILAHTVYQNFHRPLYEMVEHLISSSSDLLIRDIFMVICMIPSLLWVFVKYKWFSFIIHGIQIKSDNTLIRKRENFQRIKYSLLCFVLMCYAIPVSLSSFNCFNIYMTRQAYNLYEMAVDNKKYDDAKRYGIGLIKNQLLPKHVRYNISLLVAAIMLEKYDYEKYNDLHIPLIEKNYKALDELVWKHLYENEDATIIISMVDLKNVMKKMKEDGKNPSHEGLLYNTISNRFPRNIFILTPFDNSDIPEIFEVLFAIFPHVDAFS